MKAIQASFRAQACRRQEYEKLSSHQMQPAGTISYAGRHRIANHAQVVV